MVYFGLGGMMAESMGLAKWVFCFIFVGESWFHFAVEELAVWNVLCLLFFFFGCPMQHVGS